RGGILYGLIGLIMGLLSLPANGQTLAVEYLFDSFYNGDPFNTVVIGSANGSVTLTPGATQTVPAGTITYLWGQQGDWGISGVLQFRINGDVSYRDAALQNYAGALGAGNGFPPTTIDLAAYEQVYDLGPTLGKLHVVFPETIGGGCCWTARADVQAELTWGLPD